MKKPAIEFLNESIEIGNVKAKAWRETAKIKSRKEGEIIGFDEMINYIVAVFDNPKVTVERVESEVNMENIYPLFLQTYAYVLELVTAGLSKVNEAAKKNETAD